MLSSDSIPSGFGMARLRVGGIKWRAFSTLAIVSVISLSTLKTYASTIYLGSAASFAVLGGAEVTNVGPTDLEGDLGVDPGTSITGFSSSTVTGTTNAGDGVAGQAHSIRTRRS